jgi:mRNA-degrading endonuclease RelE of RelBE toxin-antitoxin system
MNFESTQLFDKQAKKLAKKYKQLKSDLQKLLLEFDTYHQNATVIQRNLYKIRVANSSKNRGKRAGFRIYYYLKIKQSVYFLTIYDKSEVEMIDEELLKELIKEFER